MAVARRGRPTGGPLPPPVTTGMARRDTRQDQGAWRSGTAALVSPDHVTRPGNRTDRDSACASATPVFERISGGREAPADVWSAVSGFPTSRWDSPRACGGPRRTLHRTAVRSGFADGARPSPRAPARVHHLRIRGDARRGLPLLPRKAPVSLMTPGNAGLTGHLRGRPGTSQRGSSPSSAVALPSTAESELRGPGRRAPRVAFPRRPEASSRGGRPSAETPHASMSFN